MTKGLNILQFVVGLLRSFTKYKVIILNNFQLLFKIISLSIDQIIVINILNNGNFMNNNAFILKRYSGSMVFRTYFINILL